MKQNSNESKSNSGYLKKTVAVFIILLPFLSFAYQYFLSRPRIIVDEIIQREENSFNRTFWLKNSGSTAAKCLKLYLRNFNITDNKGVTLRTRKGDDIRLEAPELLISCIDVSPQQKVSFTLSEFIKFKPGFMPQKATINLYFEFKDFMRFISYKNDISYGLFPENDHLIWKQIGPKYHW